MVVRFVHGDLVLCSWLHIAIAGCVGILSSDNVFVDFSFCFFFPLLMPRWQHLMAPDTCANCDPWPWECDGSALTQARSCRLLLSKGPAGCSFSWRVLAAGFPRWFSECPLHCTLPCGHASTCACSRHVLQPWAAVQVLPLPHTTSKKGDASVCQVQPATPRGSCFELLRSRIWVLSTVLQNCGDWESRQYPTCGHNVMVTRFGLLVQISTARPSVSASNTMVFVARSGPDHPVLDCTTGISQSLSRIRRRTRGCCGVLMPVRSHSLLTATVTLCGKLGLCCPSLGGFHFSLFRLEVCGRSWQHSWRDGPAHLTSTSQKSKAAIPSSQVRFRDPATELSIRERVFERASAAVVQPSRRSHSLLNFCSLSLRSGWTRRSQKAPRLLWCA